MLKADTKYGQYKIWLDPEHGFHPAQVLHKGGEGDYSGRHLMAKGETAREYLKNVRFEKVGDVWVPMEADSRSDLRGTQGIHSTEDFHYKRTKITLNPDHDKLGSFDDPLKNPGQDPELKNGSRVMIENVPAIYTWQDGELIPNVDKAFIDQLDKMAAEIMADKGSSDTKSKLTPASVTASDLLGKYAATQDKLRSFIAKGESLIDSVNKARQSSRTKSERCRFSFDGTRVSHRSTFWDGLLTTKEKPGYKSFLWDGKRFVEFNKSREPKYSRVFVKQNDLGKNEKIATEYKGAALLGFLAGDNKRIDSILSKVDTISLRNEKDKIGETDCFVIDAVTKRGKYTVWIDPEHGYNIAKVDIRRSQGDLVNSPLPLKASMSFSLDNVRFEQIDAVWVPMEADMEQAGDNGTKTTKWHHKRTEMFLNPDHDVLGSFLANDIPDGVKVIRPGRFDRTAYVWQNGKAVVEADNDAKQ